MIVIYLIKMMNRDKDNRMRIGRIMVIVVQLIIISKIDKKIRKDQCLRIHRNKDREIEINKMKIDKIIIIKNKMRMSKI